METTEPTAHKVRYRRLPDGSWGVSGPPELIKKGEVEVTTKSGKTEVVTVLRLGPKLKNRETAEPFRVGYLEPLILNPADLLIRLSQLTHEVKRAADKLGDLEGKLTRLERAFRRAAEEPEDKPNVKRRPRHGG